MAINIMALCDAHNVISYDGCIPWKFKEDMKRFKLFTTNRVVIMGHCTFKSLNNHPLPNRRNMVLTKSEIEKKGFGVYWVHSLYEAIEYWKLDYRVQIYIIGGTDVYREAMGIADRIYLTKAHSTYPVCENPRYFQYIDPDVWKLNDTIQHEEFDFLNYVRK